MCSIELEQEYIYDGITYTVCCTLDYTVKGQYLRPTAEEPAEYPVVSVDKWVVDAILTLSTDTMDSKTTTTHRKLSCFDTLYAKIEQEFILDDEWFLQDEIEEKILEDYKARLEDQDR